MLREQANAQKRKRKQMHKNESEYARRVTTAWLRVEHAVRSFVISVISPFTDAEDVIQAVAVAMVERFDDYDENRPLMPWALGIARHKMLDHIRRRGRDRLVLNESALEILEAAHIATAEESEPERHALWDCLKQLADRQRRAFTLRYQDDLPPRQIAEEMGTTSAAISSLLRRGRDSLQECVRHRLALAGEENPHE